MKMLIGCLVAALVLGASLMAWRLARKDGASESGRSAVGAETANEVAYGRDGPVPAFSLESLKRESDAILVVTRSAEKGVFTVSSVLSGGVGVNEPVTFPSWAIPDSEKGVDVLVFAKRDPTGAGRYLLTSEDYGTLLVEHGRQPESTDIGQALVGYVLRGVESRNPAVLGDALVWARHLENTSITACIAELVARLPDPPVALEAAYLQQAVLGGDGRMLRRAIAFVDGDPKRIDQRSRSWLVRSLVRIRDTDDVAFMNSLLVRQDDIGRAAVLSCRDWADRTTLPSIRIVMDSQDQELVYSVIVAACRILDHPGPGYNDYMRDPGKYLPDLKKLVEDAGRQSVP